MARRLIASDEAYVAIDETGFVEGACFTESEDAAQWNEQMKAIGCRIEIMNRLEAKRILFTRPEASEFVFLA